ncbi:MAG: polysaccharide deacetylase family protein [Caldilineaceae bacterium]
MSKLTLAQSSLTHSIPSAATATATAIPILMYHEVAPAAAPAFRKYTVAPQAFARQMRWLRLAGYHPITLDALIAQRQGEGHLPRRPVVITFDDGFQGCCDYAVPILRAHGFTAIFYLVAGLMGKSSHWLQAERGLTLPLMDWTAARRLIAEGFSCGAHTMTHPRLAQLDAATCRAELVLARQQIEQQVGHPVHHLAYPFGSCNATVRNLAAEAGYRSACTVEIGHVLPTADLLLLRRVPVLGQDSLADFICRLSTARTVQETLRDGLHVVRRKVKTAVRRETQL